jgi:ribosomal protein S18 acetylase RimI-like enzyme
VRNSSRFSLGTSIDLEKACAELRERSIKLAYWEAPYEDTEARAIAAHLGGVLINTRLSFECVLETRVVPGPIRTVRAPTSKQYDALIDLALAAGWSSRFALDPRFPRAKREKLYRAWLDNSLNRTIADAVIVDGEGEAIDAMVTVAARGETGQIGLFSVAETARGRGLGKALLRDALNWFAQQGCARARVVTQGENAGAVALYRSCGFIPVSYANVFHFWNQKL